MSKHHVAFPLFQQQLSLQLLNASVFFRSFEIFSSIINCCAINWFLRTTPAFSNLLSLLCNMSLIH